MMAIIVKVAAGKRPGLELVRDDWPGECHQMLDLMKRCWDQDPKQRPSFAGGTGAWISHGETNRDKFVSSSLSYISKVWQLLVPFCCHPSPSSLLLPFPHGSCLALEPRAACPAAAVPFRYPCGDRRAAGTDPEPGAGPRERAPGEEDVPQTGPLQEPAGEGTPLDNQEIPLALLLVLARLFPLSDVQLSTFPGCLHRLGLCNSFMGIEHL